MTFVNNETVTLPARTFIFNPDTFLEDVDPENPTLKIVPYLNANELLESGIYCDARREFHSVVDGEPIYNHVLEVWAKSCGNCDESPNVDSLHAGDKLVMLGYGDYVVIRQEEI